MHPLADHSEVSPSPAPISRFTPKRLGVNIGAKRVAVPFNRANSVGSVDFKGKKEKRGLLENSSQNSNIERDLFKLGGGNNIGTGVENRSSSSPTKTRNCAGQNKTSFKNLLSLPKLEVSLSKLLRAHAPSNFALAFSPCLSSEGNKS